jgi:hypothetical protein
MLKTWAARLCLSVGVLLGVALSYVGTAGATRNSSGTYSLPSGNPVVSGTTIGSSWANNTLSDIGTEITNSLDRSGRGAMTAPLQCSSGSAAAPSLTFSADSDTGLYRVGANNVGLSLGGSKVIDFSTTTPLAVTGAATISAGATVTQSTSNGAGVTGTGNGSGAGGVFTGGATGAGVTGTGGATSGNGGTFTATGTGTNYGVRAIGIAGTESYAIYATSAGANHAIVAVGSGGGSGGVFTGGATGDGINVTVGGSGTANTTTRNAINVIAGNVKLGGGAPTSTTGFSNTLTAMNIPKAWALVDGNGASAATVTAGFNAASVAESGGDIRLNFTTPFSGSYGCLVSTNASGYIPALLYNSTSQVEVRAKDVDGLSIDLTATTANITIVCYGAN